MTKELQSQLLELQNKINSLEVRIKGLLLKYFEYNCNAHLHIKTVDLIPFSELVLINRLTRFETSMQFENVDNLELNNLFNLLKESTKKYYILKY